MTVSTSAILKLSPSVLLYQAGTPAPKLLTANSLHLAQLPGSAFGDGSHPTTRLCAGAVDFLCRQKRVKSFLDVGTGTGILSRIARARGAEFVAATDIDPIALQSARENSQLDSNALPIEILNTSPDHWGARFELVVANILEGTLRSLSQSLAASLAPDGVLLLSGFTRLQVPTLSLTFTELGLTPVQESHLDGWTLLGFKSVSSSLGSKY